VPHAAIEESIHMDSDIVLKPWTRTALVVALGSSPAQITLSVRF